MSEVTEEVGILISQLEPGIAEDFFNWGSDLAGYGSRFFKHSDR